MANNFGNQLPMVQLLLKFKADPNDSQTDGRSLLFSALSDTNILEALLDAGADPNRPDKILPNAHQGSSPLMSVVGGSFYETAEGNLAAAKLLIAHGANPNFKNANGNTALHYAVNVGGLELVRLLLDVKADPNAKNNDGITPLSYAKANQNGIPAGPLGTATGADIAALLRQHGALDVLPDWDRITVSRPSANFSQAVFQKATNDWNQFTLLETICGFDQNDNRSNNPLAFADLSHIVVVRPSTNGATAKRIEVNLLHATNGVDCSKDIPLEFGDAVEIPEREHTLAEPPIYLPKDQFMAIFNYLRNKAGEAKLIVKGGETVSLPLQEFYSQIGNVLLGKPAQTVLTSSSDLARVKVIRPGLKTGMANQWILDCSHLSRTTTGGLFAPNGGAPDLILRDGDVIEVPEKP
jgi:ankyrin repeat protein